MSDRYRCPAIDTVWTTEAVLERWVTVEAAASVAIGHPFSIVTVSSEAVEALERSYGHDVAAFVETLRKALQDRGATDAARWLHYGLCSSDVVDAGWLLGIRSVTDQLSLLSRTAQTSLFDLDRRGTLLSLPRPGGETARSERYTLYRTHGQPALVAHSRARWTGHADALAATTEQVQECMPTRIGFDGPVGTGDELTESQRRQIADTLGLFPRRDSQGRQAADREVWAQWLGTVARAATVCERIATDIRLLATLGEVSEGHGPDYRGSSSMPHKVNPTRSERICGLAPIIRGLANGYAEAAASCWGSHSLEHSSAERIAIPQVTSLTGYVLTELADIVSSLVFHDEVIAANVTAAPSNSYAERNRLIREGMDGGDAWTRARIDAIAPIEGIGEVRVPFAQSDHPAALNNVRLNVPDSWDEPPVEPTLKELLQYIDPRQIACLACGRVRNENEPACTCLVPISEYVHAQAPTEAQASHTAATNLIVLNKLSGETPTGDYIDRPAHEQPFVSISEYVHEIAQRQRAETCACGHARGLHYGWMGMCLARQGCASGCDRYRASSAPGSNPATPPE